MNHYVYLNFLHIACNDQLSHVFVSMKILQVYSLSFRGRSGLATTCAGKLTKHGLHATLFGEKNLKHLGSFKLQSVKLTIQKWSMAQHGKGSFVPKKGMSSSSHSSPPCVCVLAFFLQVKKYQDIS